MALTPLWSQVRNDIGWILLCLMNIFYLPQMTVISQILWLGHLQSLLDIPNLRALTARNHRDASRQNGGPCWFWYHHEGCGAPCTNGTNSLRMIVSEVDLLSVQGAPTSFIMKMHHLWRPSLAHRRIRSHAFTPLLCSSNTNWTCKYSRMSKRT